MWPAVALSVDKFWDKGETVPWDDPDTGRNQGGKEQVFPGVNENVYKLSKFGDAILAIWYEPWAGLQTHIFTLEDNYVLTTHQKFGVVQ